MSRIVRVKNNSGSNSTWVGKSIVADAYIELTADTQLVWASESQVITDISNGNLIINNGTDDITDGAMGLKWLQGNVEPPVTADGDWHIVNENFAHVTGNNVINWTIEKFLDSESETSEKYVIPVGRTVTLNFFEGGSFDVPTYIKVEWFKDFSGTFKRVNPDIRVSEIWTTTLSVAATTGDTTVSVVDASDIDAGMLFGFECNTEECMLTVASVDTDANTITFETPLPVDKLVGDKIGLVDRVIGQKGNQIASSAINWVSPPRFTGDGSDYLLLTIKNEDSTDGGLVTAMINGWDTSTGVGD